MTRETLETILAAAPGGKPEAASATKPEKGADKKSARPASTDEHAFTFSEDHRVSLYLALGQSGTVVSEIVRLVLGPLFLAAEQKDRTRHFVEYDAVRGLSVRPPRSDGESTRTGF